MPRLSTRTTYPNHTSIMRNFDRHHIRLRDTFAFSGLVVALSLYGIGLIVWVIIKVMEHFGVI